MKKVDVSILMALTAMTAFSQGTVFFANDSVSLPSPPDRLIRFSLFSPPTANPYGTNLAPAVGTNYQVQLYFGASTAAESSLTPVTATPARLRPTTTSSPGVWANQGS